MRRLLIGSLLLSIVGCRTRAPHPVNIEASDICSYCKMAISERLYAAEFINSDGNAFKFDDIGCMVHFLRQRRVPVEPVAFFVTDYDQRNWLPAETASYEQSAQVPTPMASGLLAVDNRSRGEEYARRFHGQVLDFSRVLGP